MDYPSHLHTDSGTVEVPIIAEFAMRCRRSRTFCRGGDLTTGFTIECSALEPLDHRATPIPRAAESPAGPGLSSQGGPREKIIFSGKISTFIVSFINKSIYPVTFSDDLFKVIYSSARAPATEHHNQAPNEPGPLNRVPNEPGPNEPGPQ